MAITVEVTLHNRDYIRILVRSLQCLSRISPDLIIETAADRLILRALSATQSAYAHFTFRKSFFHTFQIRQDNGVAANADDVDDNDNGGGGIRGGGRNSKPTVRHYKVAVNSRYILLPFRQLNGIDAVTMTLTSRLHETFARIELADDIDEELRRQRSVDHCLLIVCESHVTQLQRTYRLNYEEQSNIMQADFNRRQCTTIIAAKAKSVNSWIQHFDTKLDELTITLTPTSAKLKSFLDEQTNALAAGAAGATNSRGTIAASADGSELRKGMLTEYTISAGEFLQYDVAEETFHQPLTFCLKEVKALLGLIELVDAPVYIFAHRAGVPLMFTNTLHSITANTNAPNVTSLTALTTQSALPEAVFEASPSAADGRGAMLTQWSAELVVATLDDLAATSLSQSQQMSSQPRTSGRTTEVLQSASINRAAEALLTLPTPRRAQQERSRLIDNDQLDMQIDNAQSHGERDETEYQEGEEESEWRISGIY